MAIIWEQPQVSVETLKKEVERIVDRPMHSEPVLPDADAEPKAKQEKSPSRGFAN
jgi:hypothetical protein